MKMIVKAHGNEYGEVNYAVVDIDPKDILARRKLLRATQALAKEMGVDAPHHLSFGYAADFCSRSALEPDDSNDLAAAFLGDLSRFDKDDTADAMKVADDFELSGDAERSVCDELVVYDDTFHWHALEKHADGSMETEGISFDDPTVFGKPKAKKRTKKKPARRRKAA